MTFPLPHDGDDEIDRTTAAVVSNAIGERLRRDMGTEAPLPSRLQILLNQLQQRDEDNA